jgi:hypothetical protein
MNTALLLMAQCLLDLCLEHVREVRNIGGPAREVNNWNILIIVHHGQRKAVTRSDHAKIGDANK